jgi:hypothetical protein
VPVVQCQLDLDSDLAPVEHDEPVVAMPLPAAGLGGDLAVQLALADPLLAGMAPSTSSRTSMTAAMCASIPVFGHQTASSMTAMPWPRRVSQTNTGSPTRTARPRAQPARSHRVRSQRAAGAEQSISRASCGSVTAYCSPTIRKSSTSRAEQRTAPASDLVARALSVGGPS